MNKIEFIQKYILNRCKDYSKNQMLAAEYAQEVYNACNAYEAIFKFSGDEEVEK